MKKGRKDQAARDIRFLLERLYPCIIGERPLPKQNRDMDQHCTNKNLERMKKMHVQVVFEVRKTAEKDEGILDDVMNAVRRAVIAEGCYPSRLVRKKTGNFPCLWILGDDLFPGN